MSVRQWLGLALPLLVIAAGVVRGELALATGRAFRFRIEGYDPRDLLRGHYLQFRIAFDFIPGTESSAAASEDSCLCLSEVESD